MGKFTSSLGLIASTLIVFFLFSCGINSAKSKKEREEILKEIMSYKDKLPYNIPGTSLSITDIELDNDIIVYKCKVGNEDWEDIFLSSEASNSDRNLARVISNASSDDIDKFIDYGLGLKYIYISVETGETLLEIEMTAEKMKEIRDKINTGKIEPYSLIELAQMELSKMDIPSQLEEGVWLSDAYIEGNNIYYIATIENEVDKSDLSNADLREMKEELIEGLKNEGLVMMHKEEMVKENIHFVYVFKDSRGLEFARVDISPYDF